MKTVRVLAAEDNRVDAKLLRLAFESDEERSIELVMVDDGMKALAYLTGLPPYEDAAPPDLVLLDWGMPGCDGIEVLQAIRRNSRLEHLPVMMLSSLPSEVTEAKARDAKAAADGYFTKPFDGGEFPALAQAILQLYAALQTRGSASPQKSW